MDSGPLVGLKNFHVSMLAHCSLHNVNLGVCQDATGSTLLLAIVEELGLRFSYFSCPKLDQTLFMLCCKLQESLILEDEID